MPDHLPTGPRKRRVSSVTSRALAALLLISCVGLLLGSCARPNRALDSQEGALDIAGPSEHQFHSVLYFPKGNALHYPGYLVALEKTPQTTIGGPKTFAETPPPIPLLKDNVPYFGHEPDDDWNLGSNGLLHRLASDSKAMFVSHIVKYSPRILSQFDSYAFTDHCFVYNSFQNEEVTKNSDDASRIFAWRDCGESEHAYVSKRIDSLYMDGLHALDSLGQNLASDLKGDKFTHVLVIVMGWNTAQDEAVRNFNDIAGNLLEAAYQATSAPVDEHAPKGQQQVQETLQHFRPLVIGVTWPSFWSARFWNAFSYSNKARDADEVGLSWLNRLLNHTIPQAMMSSGSRARFVVVGHSFGARAATRALFSSPALAEQESYVDCRQGSTKSPDVPRSAIDLLVGLQGAVSLNRFSKEAGDEGSPYRDFASLRTQIVLTASKYDKAAGGPVFWYDPSGSIRSYDLACNGDDWHKSVFDCARAEDTSAKPGGAFRIYKHDGKSEWTAQGVSNTPKRVLYVDASDGITRFSSPGSGGVAHSDIYRLPMGRLLWRLVENFAQYPAPAAECE